MTEELTIELNTDPLEIVRIDGPDFYIYGPAISKDNFPYVKYEEFPTNYCGAGDGLGEKIVPDHVGLPFMRVKVSPACWAHDEEFEHAPPTFDAFYAANGRLMMNIARLARQKCRWEWLIALINYRAATYMNAVNIGGSKVFWNLKAKQGHVLPWSARKFVSDDLLYVTEFDDRRKW